MAFWSFNNYVETIQKDFLAEGMVRKISMFILLHFLLLSCNKI